MRFFIQVVLLTLSSVVCGYGQIITVLDAEDILPVADAALLNETGTRFTYTNRSGKADISLFGENEIICIHHFTYENICFSIADIKKSGYVIKLTRKIFAIEEYVVSASRWEQNRNEVPNKITTILKPAAEFQNPQTAADLIAMSDNVFVQKSQLGGGSPMIRGFATNRVLIVVDGVRMNNAIYREGNIQNVISLDPMSIESTEIIFGPGASVYGSDAIGGVMDFHTKKALFSTGEKPLIRADAFTRFSTADQEKTGHFDFTAGGKKLAFLTSISWTEFGNLRMGSKMHPEYLRPEYVSTSGGTDAVVVNSDPRVQKFSGYTQLNAMNKLRWRINDKVDLSFASHYSGLSDVPRYDRLIQYKSGQLRYGDWYYGPQVWIMNNLQLTLRQPGVFADEIRVIASQQNYRESRHDRSFGKTVINEQFERVSILSLNIDADKKIKNEKGLLYYGIELVSNAIKSVAQTRDILSGVITPSGSRYPNGDNDYGSIALYSGYRNNLNEKISLNTGIRYNHVSLNSTIADNSFYNFPFTDISISNGAVTGSAGLVYRASEKMQINLNVSTGFRAPNLDDAGKVFDSAPGVVVVPNPGLKPEYAYNIDFGIARDFGKVLHLEVTAFHTWLTDAMIRHDFLFNGNDSIIYNGVPSKVEAITNTGSATVYGLHFNLQLNLNRNLSLKTTLNITEGKEAGGTPLRHAAPFFGSTHLIWEKTKFKADFYSVYNGAKTAEKMPPTETEKPYMYATDSNGKPWSPGWYTINFKLGYNFTKWASLNGGVENILDHRYRPYASGIVAPGRNYIISLRINI